LLLLLACMLLYRHLKILGKRVLAAVRRPAEYLEEQLTIQQIVLGQLQQLQQHAAVHLAAAAAAGGSAGALPA
jgi:hypothetical protein